MAVPLAPFSLDRTERAVERVRERLLRVARTLDAADVPYAVAGGHAVALWVARVDEAAVRNTRDVDILLRREDLPAARAALEAEGFVYRHVGGLDVFLDSPAARVRDAVHFAFANEQVRPGEPAISPDVSESEAADRFRVLSLPALIRVKLTAFRRKDQVHLLDMIETGLIDRTTLATLTPALAARLQELLDDPEG